LYADSDAVFIEHTDTHSLTIGSTGSKKTRLIGMPSLFTYIKAGESFVTTDPKAELYEKMYPLLKENDYNIFVLNLREPGSSNCWNPLIIPYLLYHNNQRDKAIELINDVAGSITKNNHSCDPYWHNSAADLLTGLILLLCECAGKNEINFKSLRMLRTQAFKSNKNEIPYIKEYFLDHLDASSFICSLLNGTAEVYDSTRGCIVSVFDLALRPFFSQDNLIDMLSVNDIDMGKIGIEKTAVFMIMPDENTLYHSLICVFIKLRYGDEAGVIKGNCEDWVVLHSREKSMIEELIFLAGNKNHEEPLISASMFQTMSKEEGEAFILNKRSYPFITKLLDIDSYPDIMRHDKKAAYPKNNRKVKHFFNLENFCREKDDFFLSQLFSGKSHEEISKDCKGLEKY